MILIDYSAVLVTLADILREGLREGENCKMWGEDKRAAMMTLIETVSRIEGRISDLPEFDPRTDTLIDLAEFIATNHRITSNNTIRDRLTELEKEENAEMEGADNAAN